MRDEDETIGEESRAHFKAALAATQESRAELLRLLHAGEIHESVAHEIETELDLEEIRWRKLAEAISDPNAPETSGDDTGPAAIESAPTPAKTGSVTGTGN